MAGQGQAGACPAPERPDAEVRSFAVTDAAAPGAGYWLRVTTGPLAAGETMAVQTLDGEIVGAAAAFGQRARAVGATFWIALPPVARAGGCVTVQFAVRRSGADGQRRPTGAELLAVELIAQ